MTAEKNTHPMNAGHPTFSRPPAEELKFRRQGAAQTLTYDRNTNASAVFEV
jgi:hypothetical protein